MVDIRMVRRSSSYVWLLTGALALVALLIWAAATYLGDPTERTERTRIGAAANFGGDRAPVLPAQPAAFASMTPLEQGDLGRLVHLTGTVESRVVASTAWVRAADGRRILVRFEPPPPEGALAGIRSGGRIDVEGYLQSMAVAEFRAWADTLRISLPRPPPATRFGQAPSPEFLRTDSLYIREFYISVRPEGLTRRQEETSAVGGRR
ncbi:MAG TPA: hypothetical protein VGR27_10565 [Longimicrobiaceae bacterium]|nr:hypothetical protein [Longimicrobiaceae bacterium]